MSVIEVAKLSETVILTLIRDKMRDDILDPTIPLNDPKSQVRGDRAPMIMTSYPTVGVFYPHVVLEEFNQSGGRLDSRVDLFQTDFSVKISILADTNTELYRLKDQVRDWIQRNLTYLNRQGFAEVRIASTTPTNFDEDATVKSFEIIIVGQVYSSYEI